MHLIAAPFSIKGMAFWTAIVAIFIPIAWSVSKWNLINKFLPEKVDSTFKSLRWEEVLSQSAASCLKFLCSQFLTLIDCLIPDVLKTGALVTPTFSTSTTHPPDSVMALAPLETDATKAPSVVARGIK